MTEIHVRKCTREPEEVRTVIWMGDGSEGRLLQTHHWVIGMDIGFDRNAEGNDVLRGIVSTPWGTQRAFPGDVIVKDSEGALTVWDPEAFAQHFRVGSDFSVLANDEQPAHFDSNIPTGDDPNAVNLDTDPEEVNKLISHDDLRQMAAEADLPGDHGEKAEFELNELLLHNGWDPDADTSLTWTAMIENVIASGITIQPKPKEPEVPDNDETQYPSGADEEDIEEDEENDGDVEDEDDDDEDDE